MTDANVNTKYYIREALMYYDPEDGEAICICYITYYNNDGVEVLEDGSPIGNVSAREDEVIEVFDTLEQAIAYIR